MMHKCSFKTSGAAHRRTRWWITSSALLCLFIQSVVTPSAYASENQFFSGILEFSDLLIPDKTHVTVGLGPILRPDYIGSDTYEVDAEPSLYLRFEGLFTLENDGAALNLLGMDKVELGPTARFTRGRNERDNIDLTGLGDVGLSFDTGAYVKIKLKNRYSARLRYTHAIVNSANGGLLDIRLSAVLYRKNKLTLATALRGNWLTSQRSQRFFGITGAQSERSGKPVFSPSAGFRDTRVDLLAQWQFAEKWALNGFTSYSRLIGDPASSPIVDTAGSLNQFTLGAYLTYRFSFSTE